MFGLDDCDLAPPPVLAPPSALRPLILSAASPLAPLATSSEAAPSSGGGLPRRPSAADLQLAAARNARTLAEQQMLSSADVVAAHQSNVPTELATAAQPLLLSGTYQAGPRRPTLPQLRLPLQQAADPAARRTAPDSGRSETSTSSGISFGEVLHSDVPGLPPIRRVAMRGGKVKTPTRNWRVVLPPPQHRAGTAA